MLRLELLHAVLAEQPLTGLEGLQDVIGGQGLADRHQRNFAGLAPGTKRGGGHTLPNLSNVSRYRHAS
jgi:hypothetical protein